MDDAGLVASFECFRKLPCYGERFLDRDASFPHSLCERRSFDELEHERSDSVGVFKLVDARDVRMVQ